MCKRHCGSASTDSTTNAPIEEPFRYESKSPYVASESYSSSSSSFPVNGSNASNGSGISNDPTDAWQHVFESIEDTKGWSARQFDRANKIISEKLGTSWSIPGSGLLGELFEGRWDRAYPVPTPNRYHQCQNAKGVSLWTDDGVWRCLFPGKDKIDFSNNQMFKDYTGYLEFKVAMEKAAAAKAAKAAQEAATAKAAAQAAAVQEATKTAVAHGAEPSREWPREWQRRDGEKPFWRKWGRQEPRLISEQEAKGKKPVSERTTAETVTLPNGSTETRQTVYKLYADNTALVKESVQNGGRGWFW